MRAPVFFGIVLLPFVTVFSSFGQTTNQSTQAELPAATNAAPAQATGLVPLPKLIVGDKTFESVTLTGFDGKTVVVSHAYGVKNIPLSDLKPDQIEALNGTSEKIKIVVQAPPPASASTNAPPVAVNVLTTNAPPATAVAGQTNVLTRAVPPAPVENPAALAQAAARTEAMIQDFKAVGRSENESEPEEDVPVRVPGVVRFLIWAVCSTASILLIFFLSAGYLRRRARKK